MFNELPPREREVAEIVYRRIEAGSADVWDEIKDRCSRSSVRTMLQRLTAKRILKRTKSVGRVTYSLAFADDAVRTAAADKLLKEYFGGSVDELLRCIHGGGLAVGSYLHGDSPAHSVQRVRVSLARSDSLNENAR